jgi:hypothetical protein
MMHMPPRTLVYETLRHSKGIVTVATELSKDDMRRFARLGAMKRLDDIRKEEASIRASFPELFSGARRRGAAKTPAKNAAKAVATRKRPPMSRAMRKAVSDRMKKYWAGRKAKNG